MIEKMKRNNPKQPSTNYAVQDIYHRTGEQGGTKARNKQPHGGFYKAKNAKVYPVHITKS